MHNSPVQKYCYVLLLLSFSLTSLSQTHRYVNPSGTDSGTCSEPGSPCQSIDYAITQAAANDVLNLTEGTFTATTLSTRVVLSGRGTGTVVQGITVNAAVSGTDPVSIENLTVTSSSTHGITIGTSYVELFNVNSSNHSGRNVNIDAATAIQNITISNCVLDGGDYGLWLTEQTDLTNLTVLNTSMDNNTIGFYSQLGNSASAGIRLAAVLVRNCTFNNNLRKGIYAEKLENAIFENITVDNSGTDATYDFNNGIDINLKWQAYSGITIRNSRVINSGAIGSNDIATAPDNRHTSAIAIKARTDAGSYNGTPASLTNVTLDGVIIDGLVTDLRFGEMGKTDNDGMDMSTVTVQHCSFTNDNLAGLLNEENTNTLTISNNYWGGAGPTGTDIEFYGTSAFTSQSGELANEIVDASNNSYATVAAALAAGGTIQNLPSGTVSGTSTVSLATTLISPGAGNLHSGSLTTFETLNISGADLTLGSDLAVSTTLDVSASRNAVLDDYNLLLSGTVTGAGEIAGSSTSGVYFSGTGALGTLTFASGARELERLDLNRTSTGTVTLGADLDVALLSLTNGILNTGANNLNFTGITALQGNDNSFVNGNFVNQVTGTPAGNTIVFPVGVTEYRPISIEGLDQSGTTSYTGTVTESTPPSSTAFLGNSLLDKLSLTRYWTVTPSAFNVTGADLITLTYGDAENVSDQGNLRVAQFQTSDWYNLGGSGASPISSGGTPPNAIALTLGDFALGDEPGGTNFTEIATVFVNASTGDDANDGASSGTPKLTLTAGFNLVQSAGTINIAAGSYGETIDINQPVTIAGTGSPTTTSVTLNADITLTDFSSTTVNVGSLGIVQDGIDLAAIAGTVNVVAGTFNETLAVGKALTLNGANVGIAGNSASRGAETIVEPASAVIGLTISSSDVTINGFQFGTDNSTSNNTTAISSVANTNLSISNNVIFANGTGMSIAGASSGTIGVLNNSVEMLNLVDPLNITVPSFGIVAQSITGTADADFTDNDLQTASYGIFGYELTASPTVTINGGSFVGCTKGIEINNTDGSNFSPSTVDILNVVMSSFADPVLPQPDTQAGIYAYVTGNATATDDLVVSINNADISGIGSGGTDYAAIYIADFQATGPFDGTDDDGIAVTATVSNSNIHDNSNRGIYSRGRNAVTTVTQTTLSGNGSVAGAGGVVFAFGTLNISNSVIVNPATGTVDALLAQNNGTITATNNSFDDNGNGDLADVQSGGTIDMSRNWLGSINETTISALVDLAGVDFTPWIENGTDTDGATAGFQPDLDTLYVGTTGTQTGSTGRWQEGHDLVDALGTVVLANADYAETVTVTKSVTFEPTSGAGDTSLDNLVMNGTGVTMTLEGNLLIDNAVTLTDGNIDVNSGELRLGVSATDITEIAASQIAGRVTMDPRLVGTGALSILGVSISANPADNLGNVSITRNTGPGAVIVGGPNSSIAANWDITVDTEPVNAGRDVTFTWLSDFDNGLAMTGVNVFRNGGSGWVEVAGPFDASLSDPRTVTANAVTQFSIWSMAPASAPLPVELVSFEGQNSNGKVELRWSTMTELNADYFEIQKSFDAASFVAAHQVDAAGNSNVVRKYSWTDPASLRTTSFYRLKIVDFDGSHEYSSIVGVDPMISTEITVFPNPTTDYVHVGHAGELTYSLYDQQGRRIQSGIVETGRVDLSQLKSGVYFLQLGKQERKKLIKK